MGIKRDEHALGLEDVLLRGEDGQTPLLQGRYLYLNQLSMVRRTDVVFKWVGVRKGGLCPVRSLDKTGGGLQWNWGPYLTCNE